MILSSPLGAIIALISTVSLSSANLLTPLTPEEGAASDLAKRFQPALDFDMDSCYHVAAEDINSNYNPGLELDSFEQCRSEDRLYHSNAYVRRRCNHGWCAYLYGYYFEKDVGFFAGSHVHDWEHVIVWTLNDEIFYVSWSAHGDYTTVYKDSVRYEGDTHVKIVNHLGGVRTHSFRKAEGDDEPPENAFGEWFMADLVDLTWQEPWSVALGEHDFGSAHPDFGDDFGDKLRDCPPPWDATHNEGFDPYDDTNTWDGM